MDETVWLFFSVLAVILTLSIVGVLIMRNNEATDMEHFLRSIDELKIQCDYVCDSGTGTNLPVEVVFPAGSLFYTKSEKICGTFMDKNHCRLCKCNLDAYELNLNTTFAKEVLKSHKYTCYLERKTEGVLVDCQG